MKAHDSGTHARAYLRMPAASARLFALRFEPANPNCALSQTAQLASLPTAAMARTSLRNGFAIVATTLEQVLLFANRIGAEHVEIMAADAAAVARGVRNAGAIFLGTKTPEALGDYGAGPNHVLPTGSTSRFSAGLSVFSFVRARTWLRIENLEAHARSVERRAAGRLVVP